MGAAEVARHAGLGKFDGVGGARTVAAGGGEFIA